MKINPFLLYQKPKKNRSFFLGQVQPKKQPKKNPLKMNIRKSKQDSSREPKLLENQRFIFFGT